MFNITSMLKRLVNQSVTGYSAVVIVLCIGPGKVDIWRPTLGIGRHEGAPSPEEVKPDTFVKVFYSFLKALPSMIIRNTTTSASLLARRLLSSTFSTILNLRPIACIAK